LDPLFNSLTDAWGAQICYVRAAGITLALPTLIASRAILTNGEGIFMETATGAPNEVSTSSVIKVAIVEDDRSLREGLGLLINATAGFRCPRTFGSVEEALHELGENVPEVLLLDIHLPGMLGSDGVKVFRERFPQMQVLMLTVYAEQDKIFESICNGACGYLLKKTPPARLLDSIREAHEGGSPMSPEIARKVV